MILVKIKTTGEVRVLIGTGYGVFKAYGQKGWGSFPSTSKGEKFKIATCDKTGSIEWIESDSCEVIEVDGIAVQDCIK
ncbi:hypothetical protein KHQ81_07770 [Mycoplasmatota bacterium]|nr:hypothetical protein KHQ81_07770 [Mycoplasmatota bacterium]